MFDAIDTLRVLADVGTMGKTALRLRITQSAVSKRIAGLERDVGVPLIEPVGRRVRLTSAGVRILEEVAPLLAEARARLGGARSERSATVRVGCSESFVASWLAPVLVHARDDVPDVQVELHVHRGPWVMERLRAGEIDVAVCVGGAEEGLHVSAMGTEPMVLVRSGGGTWTPTHGEVVSVMSIEPGSLTGGWLARRLPRVGVPWGGSLEITLPLGSFGAVAGLTLAGFGHGLLPAATARAVGLTGGLPLPGFERPVVVCTRNSAWVRPMLRRYTQAITERGRSALSALGAPSSVPG